MGELIPHPEPADHSSEVHLYRRAGALIVRDKLLVCGGSVYRGSRLVPWKIVWLLLDRRKHLFGCPRARLTAGISSDVALPPSHELRWVLNSLGSIIKGREPGSSLERL